MPEGKIAEYALANRDAFGDLRENVNTTYFAQGFKHAQGVDTPITKIIITALENGAVAATKKIWAEIWNDNTAGSSHKIGDSSSLKEAADIAADWENVELTWAAGPSLVSGTQYWVILTGDYAISAVNNISIGLDNPGAYGDGHFSFISNTFTWNDLGSTIDLVFEIYGTVVGGDEVLLYSSMGGAGTLYKAAG